MPKGKNSRLQLNVIKEMHDQFAVSYSNTKITLIMLYQHYYWPGMCVEVEQYLQNCYVCKQAKSV